MLYALSGGIEVSRPPSGTASPAMITVARMTSAGRTRKLMSAPGALAQAEEDLVGRGELDRDAELGHEDDQREQQRPERRDLDALRVATPEDADADPEEGRHQQEVPEEPDVDDVAGIQRMSSSSTNRMLVAVRKRRASGRRRIGTSGARHVVDTDVIQRSIASGLGAGMARRSQLRPQPSNGPRCYPREDDRSSPSTPSPPVPGPPRPSPTPPTARSARCAPSAVPSMRFAREDWDALAARTPWATAFSSWAFHRAWWDAYAPTRTTRRSPSFRPMLRPAPIRSRSCPSCIATRWSPRTRSRTRGCATAGISR